MVEIIFTGSALNTPLCSSHCWVANLLKPFILGLEEDPTAFVSAPGGNFLNKFILYL